MSAAEIGLKLGVSKHAVISKARRLGLSSPSINREVGNMPISAEDA